MIALSRWLLAGAMVFLLAGCDPSLLRSPIPPERPVGLAPDTPDPNLRSVKSQDLERYYTRVQNDLLTRGLLRTDGGGPDTPFDAEDLVRNFENIAFFDEYARGAQGRGAAGRLTRWSAPVRVNVEFGASVPTDQRDLDRANIERYAGRLGRVTGHPVGFARSAANFHVLVAGEDDAGFVQTRVQELIPTIGADELSLIGNLPRSFYCLVFAVSGSGNPYDYTRAVALIRMEHPDLVRLSCIHEEIAQGLGLPNDYPGARPSIFNDDDEFALLTSHDEMLLRMLYDPRLGQGMTADQARPVARIIARELMGQQL